MDNKGIKKSTMQQLQTLVKHMEENPILARGAPVYGATKISTDEEWTNLCQKINSLGPPTRTLAEWKKTWADLKSRTKKKIGDNAKSLRETGGGLFRYSPLTELEQVIDRTLCLSSAAAPSGRMFGMGVKSAATTAIEDCFQSLVETPPRVSKAVAVITPNREQVKSPENRKLPQQEQQKQKQQQQMQQQQKQQGISAQQKPVKRQETLSDSENEQAGCSSAKKRKSVVDQQFALIRRQIRVVERSAAAATDKVDIIKRIADAAEAQAEAARRSADAAESTAAALKAIQQSTTKIEEVLNHYILSKKY